ncbi:hypothetical protein [Bartonella pachyuromydis]|uniref:Uncharacterized protein n=1 Tax=Bartonella pachyuromydis TaxID=931097 RepID=A0ABP8VEX5_9HYPH
MMLVQNLANLPAAMVADIVYETIDDKVPTILSKKVIENTFCNKIGFYGR